MNASFNSSIVSFFYDVASLLALLFLIWHKSPVFFSHAPAASSWVWGNAPVLSKLVLIINNGIGHIFGLFVRFITSGLDEIRTKGVKQKGSKQKGSDPFKK